MDVDFLRFVLKESLPFGLFILGLILPIVLPSPYNLIASAVMIVFCGYKAIDCFLNYMRFKYEMNKRDRERSWEILKEK